VIKRLLTWYADPAQDAEASGLLAIEPYVHEEYDCAMEGSAATSKPSAQHGRRNWWRGLWWQRAVALLLLVPTVWLSILFWAVPASNPLTVSALLLDRILQVATALALPVAVVGVAVAPWPLARPAALAGGIVSVMLGGSAVTAALRPPVEGWTTLLSVLSLVCGLGQLIWMLRRILLARKWRISLLAPLTLLPLVQFWHATSFVPARLTTSITMTAQVTSTQAVGEESRGAVEVGLRNDGDIGAILLGSWLYICERETVEDLVYDMSVIHSDPACADVSPLFGNWTDIEPNTVRTRHQAIVTRLNEPIVQVVGEAWYARTDRLQIDEQNKASLYDVRTCPVPPEYIYQLFADSRVRGVVEKQRLLIYTSDDWYFSTVDESLCEDSRYALGEHIGVGWVRNFYNDWLQVPTSQSTATD